MFPERTPCNPLSRREMLLRTACGFGAFAFRGLNPGNVQGREALSPPPGLAKRVLFLYMDGGVSQVDSFDPKPNLMQNMGSPFLWRFQGRNLTMSGRF